MTTLAVIICVSLLAGYCAGAITGFYIGKEVTEAPVMDEPREVIRPAIISPEYIDEVSGKQIYNSASVYSEDRPDGSTRQFFIQNN